MWSLADYVRYLYGKVPCVDTYRVKFVQEFEVQVKPFPSVSWHPIRYLHPNRRKKWIFPGVDALRVSL